MLLSAVALVCLALPATGAAATFTVNTTADGPVAGNCATGEECTLRDALTATAASADPEDTVIVPAGEYVLTEGELEVTKQGAVSIVGAGARATVIDGGEASRVLDLEGTLGGTTVLDTSISGLTITGGNAATAPGPYAGDGGGILLGESANELSLAEVTVDGNTATLNGGGLAAPPEGGATKTVTITDSTFSDNHVAGGGAEGLGGGIYILGELSLTNSTVTGNSAENAGLNEGGGVLTGPAPADPVGTTTVILNSTIARNSVAAGGTGGGLAMYSSEGMVTPTSTITNTIVAGNTSGTGPGDCGGAMAVTPSHDISGDASCGFTDAGSQVETDPELGPLADNGGGTDTLALLAGSPAIDAGTDEGCPATDQRGVLRPLGTACDIGSYEFQPAPPTPPAPPVSTTSTATTTTPVQPAPIADLRLSIGAKPAKPVIGKKVAFVVNVQNVGPQTAPGVVFKGTVSGAAMKVAGLPAGACELGKVSMGKREVTCQVGTVAVGTVRSFRFVVTTKKTPKYLVTRGRVRSGATDPTTKDAHAKAIAKPRS